MLIDVAHKRWGWATGALGLVAALAYALYARSTPGGGVGGSWQGLLFGLAGSALMIYAGLLGVRKKFPRWRIGSAQSWLRGHIWLGLLSVPLILFHSGFRLGGTLEQVLWAVLAAITLSGALALALQQWLPRMMTVRVPRETYYEQVPHVCALLQFEADARLADICGPWPFERPPLVEEARRKAYKYVVYTSEIPAEPPPEPVAAPVAPTQEPAGGAATAVKAAPKPTPKPRGPRVPMAAPGSAPLRQVYESKVRPFLGASWQPSSDLTDAPTTEGLFAQLRAELPPEFHSELQMLWDACDERRELAEQVKLHRLLHSWMFLHVPLTWALLVLGVAHVVSALYW